MSREPYNHYRTHVNQSTDSLVVKSRGASGERIIPQGKWWINRNTPVGDDAAWWERMPYGGRREINPANIIAVLKPPAQPTEPSGGPKT